MLASGVHLTSKFLVLSFSYCVAASVSYLLSETISCVIPRMVKYTFRKWKGADVQ